MIKILLLNIGPFARLQGGMEKVFSFMANALVERGYDVSGAVFDTQDGEPFFPISSKVKLYNVGNGFKYKKSFYYRIKRTLLLKRHKRHILDKTMYDWEKARRLKPVLEKIRPDIIISFAIEFTRIVKIYTKTDCPVITQFHSIPDVYLEELMLDSGTIRALQKSECLQVLMPSFVEDLKKYTSNDNVVVIPNAVPQHHGEFVNKSKVIINVGRVSKEKRQHLLIEAFNRLKNKFADWKVEIWGEANSNSEYCKFCKGLVKKYELEDRVLFCGTTNDVLDKLLKSSIFAFPSAFEGFPLALTEAMSAGVVSVGFRNCPSVNELIKNGSNGILCEESIEDFSEALAELMDDVDKRKKYGLQAKEDMKQYAPEKVWEQWEEVIENVVSNYNLKK